MTRDIGMFSCAEDVSVRFERCMKDLFDEVVRCFIILIGLLGSCHTASVR